MAEQDPESVREGLSEQQRRDAWAKHNRDSVLRGLEMTPAERFRWLEQAQADFVKLQASRGADA